MSTITTVNIPTDFSMEVPQEGILRRAQAGLRSILRRGFAASEIVVSREADESGFHSLEWTSEGGVWSDRPWRVTAKVTMTPRGVVVLDPRVEVGSRQTQERTAFTGRVLEQLLAERLNWVVGIIGARVSEPTDDLTEEEVDSFHDLHPSPMKAFRAHTGGRVVLEDDDYGSGWLNTHGPCKGLLRQLRQAGWEELLRERPPAPVAEPQPVATDDTSASDEPADWERELLGL